MPPWQAGIGGEGRWLDGTRLLCVDCGRVSTKFDNNNTHLHHHDNNNNHNKHNHNGVPTLPLGFP